MTTELTLTNDKIGLIKQTIMPEGSTNAELELFIHFAKRTGLDPLARQIYAMKNKGKFSILTSIDGFRLIAERSGSYAGQTIPLYYDTDSETWIDVWVKKTFPAACKVGIHRKDFIEPMYAVAHWEAYAQKKADGNIAYAWRTMPTIMLAKCAEALALRKAFPQELSGLYTSDELGEDKINEVEIGMKKGQEVLPIGTGKGHSEIANNEQVILKGTYYPEKPKKQTEKEAMVEKMKSAKTLNELRHLFTQCSNEWKNEDFYSFAMKLEARFEADFKAYIDKLTSAKDLIELQSLTAEVKPEWNTEQFKAFVKTLEHKLRAGFEEEMKEIFTAEEVKPEAVKVEGADK